MWIHQGHDRRLRRGPVSGVLPGLRQPRGLTLHLDNLRGVNAHHQAETLFKAFGRALRMAVEPDPRMAGVTPSTKGALRG